MRGAGPSARSSRYLRQGQFQVSLSFQVESEVKGICTRRRCGGTTFWWTNDALGKYWIATQITSQLVLGCGGSRNSGFPSMGSCAPPTQIGPAKRSTDLCRPFRAGFRLEVHESRRLAMHNRASCLVKAVRRKPMDLRLKPWAPSMGPEPWDPYIPTIYPICSQGSLQSP